MKNCFDCKHAILKFDKDGENDESLNFLYNIENSCFEKRYGKCNRGNEERFIEFEKKYSKTPYKKVENIEFECHEYTDETKQLNNLLNLGQKVLDEIRKINKKENKEV